MALKDRLTALRTQKNLSQVELAKKINVSPGSIGNYENGTRLPKQDILQKLADFFAIPIEHLEYGPLLNAKQKMEIANRIDERCSHISEDDLKAMELNPAEIFRAFRSRAIREDRAVQLANDYGIKIDDVLQEKYFTQDTADSYFEVDPVIAKNITLQQIYDRSRILFDAAEDASPEEIQQAASYLEYLKNKDKED